MSYNLENSWCKKNQQSEHPVPHLSVTTVRMLTVGHCIKPSLHLDAYLQTVFSAFFIEVNNLLSNG